MKKILLFLLLISPAVIYAQSKVNQVFKDHHVEGSITVYNLSKKSWLYSDSLDALRETPPGSTFDLINSCIALETGVIKTENELLKVNGKAMDLKTAYRNSSTWFYVELAKRIGKKDYTDFLKSCGYGNLDFSSKSADFWNAGPFGISPKAQVNTLKYFSREQMSFSPRTFRIGRELLTTEKTGNYILSDQTAWLKTNGKDLAWHIGYVQVKKNVYYFATRITKTSHKDNPELAKLAKEITMSILKQNKVIE